MAEIIWSEIGVKNGHDFKHTQYYEYDDGGRALAGFIGNPRDCVTRAIAIATQKPYKEVYDALNEIAKKERTGKRKRHKSNARNGVHRYTYQQYLESLGWMWIPTMKVGSGCRVHLRGDELPKGRLIVKVSKHMVAVIDGIVHDNHDSTRNGERCVYGYFHKPEDKPPLKINRI